MSDRPPRGGLGSVWIKVRVTRTTAPLPGRTRAARGIREGRRSPLALVLLAIIGGGLGLIVLQALSEGRPTADEQDLQIEAASTVAGALTSASSESSSKPRPTSTPTRPPLPTEPPEVFDVGLPSVSIRILDETRPTGNLKVSVFAGGAPVPGINFDAYKAVIDIADRWSLTDDHLYGDDIEITAGGRGLTTNFNGLIDAKIPPGKYGLVHTESHIDKVLLMKGNWGLFVQGRANSAFVPFEIVPNRTTEIIIDMAILEIGLLDPQGEALKGQRLLVFCQEEDIAGKKIPYDGFGFCRVDTRTEATGLATLNLAAGDYVVNVSFRRGFASIDEWFYDISLEPGEVRREIFTIP